MNRPQTIDNQAASCLNAASYNPRRLVLIHSGIALGFSLVLTVLNFLVTQGIGETGGLSGIATRSILGTIQTILQYASLVLVPFWQIGFLSAALAIARRQSFGPHSLLRGFSRFSSVLGLMFSQGLIIFAVAFVLLHLCAFIYMMTPLAAPLMEIMEPLVMDTSLLSGGQLYLDEATVAALFQAMTPLLIFYAVVVVVAMIPIGYHFRMAEFVLMDENRTGGLRALVISVKLMRRNCMALFRLDLKYWWFYVLQSLAMVVGNADFLLAVLGIPLPINGDVAFFLFFLLQLLGQFALHLWAKARIQTAYALVYEELKVATLEQAPPQPEAKKLPWDHE